MKKSELLALADEHGVEADGGMIKARIVGALDKHFGA